MIYREAKVIFYMDGGSTSVHLVRVDYFASLASPAGGETRASFLGREIPPVGRRVEPRRGRLTRGVPVESAVARREDSFHPVKVKPTLGSGSLPGPSSFVAISLYLQVCNQWFLVHPDKSPYFFFVY